MANNYLQFSEELAGLDSGDVEWVRDYLGFFENYHLHCGNQGIETEEHPEFVEFKLRCELYDLEWDDEDLGFQWKIENHSNKSSSVWVYSDESGNVEHVATFVQQFFKARRHNKDDWFHLSFATTCDRPRIGEFGGGAVFVTEDRVAWINTADWIFDQIKSHTMLIAGF